MSHKASLFSPLNLGPLALDNRIMVSPMCQYSAQQGQATDWHRIHLGGLAISGAGLLCLEATAVNPEGRITPYCLGLYDDETEKALADVLASVRHVSDVPLCLQLAHAGRKASSAAPWLGGELLQAKEGGWETVAPSALSHNSNETQPRALSEAGITTLLDDFRMATRRAIKLGFSALELHMAHGYLMHQFLSPIANQRTDNYGGSLENRMRLPMAVFEAVRAECTDAGANDIAIGVRISAQDWVEGGWDVEQSIALCQKLEHQGCHFIDVSSGGISPHQAITLGPGYQVPFANSIRAAIDIPVIAVGLITDAKQADAIISEGQADMVALARAFLHDPRWPWRAAATLEGTISAPPQYWRSAPYGAPNVFGNTITGQR